MESVLNDIKEIEDIIKDQKKVRGLIRGLTKRQKQTKQEYLNRRMYIETWSYKQRYH